MRQFKDAEGTRWELYEVSHETLSIGRPDFLPPAFRNGWLVFQCGGERRRLAPFPTEWRDFHEEALRSLLAGAERVATHPRAGQLRRTPPTDQSGAET